MKGFPIFRFLVLLLWLTPLASNADQATTTTADEAGQVTLPLSLYQQMIEQASQQIKPVPSSSATPVSR